jgi:hypothetical protein
MAWDEERLGKVLDANTTALAVMRRATSLERCDWGLEYELGPATPVAHLPKARVLGRLATLAGLRAAARGQAREAIDLWLSGVRFSEHVAEGGSLISALSARLILVANLRALTRATGGTRLESRDTERIAAAIRSLPETAFDWGAAIRRETDGADVWMRQLSNAADPAAAYRRVAGDDAPTPFVLPTSAQMQSFRKLMDEVASTFQMRPEAARQRLAAHDQAIMALPPVLRDLIPSVSRLNETRAEIEAERQRLLDTLGLGR